MRKFLILAAVAFGLMFGFTPSPASASASAHGTHAATKSHGLKKGKIHKKHGKKHKKHKHIKKSFGDPVTVNQHDRPVTDSKEKWAAEVRADPAKLELAHRIIDSLDPADLAAWGYTTEELFAPVASASGQANGSATGSLPALSTYRRMRQLMLALKRDIHENQFGKMVKKVRYYCDVLLRD